MDLMVRRRQLMGMQKSGLDTSPIIAHYGVKNPSGNPETKPYIIDDSYCVTDIYTYTAYSERQTLRLYGGSGNVILYQNGIYKDYWNFNGETSEHKWGVINANTNGISCSLKIALLNDCYAIMEDSGEILFAGKNSIYYGHRNTSELN